MRFPNHRGHIQPSRWETEGRSRPGFMALPGTRRHCISGTVGTGDRGGGGPRAKGQSWHCWPLGCVGSPLVALSPAHVKGLEETVGHSGEGAHAARGAHAASPRGAGVSRGAQGRVPAHALSPCLGRLTRSAGLCYLAHEDGEGGQELCKNTCSGQNLFDRPVGQRRALRLRGGGDPGSQSLSPRGRGFSELASWA